MRNSVSYRREAKIMEKPTCVHCQKKIMDLGHCSTDVLVNKNTGQIENITYLHDYCVKAYMRKRNMIAIM